MVKHAHLRAFGNFMLVLLLAVTVLQATPASAAKPRNVKAACAGQLAWLEVTSCESIAAGATDTFSITTTMAQESVLLKYTAAPDNLGMAVTLSGHDVTCELTLGPTRCDLGPVGTYTVTVQNTNEEARSYNLSAASLQHSSCTQLSAADLSPAATGHVADLTPGLIANCFGFPASVGDVLRFGQQIATATVYDATGAQVCQVDNWTATTCTASGTAPYRAFVTNVSVFESTAYRFTLARLNNPTGCAALPIAPFGDPGDGLTTGPLAGGQTTCRLITSKAGLHSVRLQTGNNSSTINSELYNQAGERVQCGEDCTLPADGTYTMLLESSATAEGNSYELEMVDLASSTGCAPESGTRWDTPAPQRTPVTAMQIDCLPIAAKAGERIVAHMRGAVAGEQGATKIVDPSGASVCPEDSEHDGCVLQGDGPFRLLSAPYTGADAPYVLDFGRLSDPVGCVPVTLTSFGAPAAGGATSRCRQLTVSTAGTYRIDPRTTYGEDYAGRGAYGSDGLQRCDNLLFCALEPGTYSIIAPVDDRIAVFPYTSTDGCATGDTTSGSVAGVSQYDCLRLSAPAGARIVQTEAAGERSTEGWVIDATGKSVCAWGQYSSPYEPDLCDLTGTAPFHAVIHRGSWDYAVNDYHLAFPRVDQLDGCKPFPPSDFTAPGGVTTTLSADRFTECYAVPANGHSAMETIEYGRTGSVGMASTYTVTLGSDSAGCLGRFAAARFTTCGFAAGEPALVLLIGSADTAGYRLARRDVTGTAQGCTAVSSTAVGATAGNGNLPDGSAVRCFKLTGAATDKFVVNTRDAHDSIGASVLRPNGDYVCKSFAAARCSVTGSTSYQVLVWNDPSFGPAGDFALEAFRISTAAGPAPECTKVDPAYGFGPFMGELNGAKTAVCVTVPMAAGNQLTGYATNQVSGGEPPVLVSFASSGTPACSSYAEGLFLCNGWQSEPWTETLLFNQPEPATGPIQYKVTATCDTPLCGGAAFGVTGVAPASAGAGVPGRRP